MTFGQNALAQIGRHGCFGASNQLDVASLKFASNSINGSASGEQRSDLVGVLGHAHRGDHIGSLILSTRQQWQQLNQKTRPHLIAYSHVVRGASFASETSNDLNWVLGFSPRMDLEHTRLGRHTWRFHARDHHARFAFAGHHQHGETLERHRVIAGDVGQVEAQ